jgi:hypothetical protein
MSSPADFFIGVSSAALDQWIRTLFAKPALRQALFSGIVPNISGAEDTTVSWAVTAPPTVSLADPGALWQGAIGADGAAPSPVPNAFSVALGSLQLSVSTGGTAARDTTVPVTALVAANLSGSVLQIVPVGVWLDMSGVAPDDQTLVRYVTVPAVMRLAHTALGGYAIPQIAPLNVALSAPSLSIGNGMLLVAMNLGGSAPPAPALDHPPSDPVFLLASAGAVRVLTKAAVQSVARRTVSRGSSADIGIASSTSSQTATLRPVWVQTNEDDLTQLTLGVEVSVRSSSHVTEFGFINYDVGYTATVSPSPVQVPVRISAIGSKLLASVISFPDVSITLTPDESFLESPLKYIATKLTSGLVNLLEEILPSPLMDGNPYTVATIDPIVQNVCGIDLSLTVDISGVQMYGGMLKAGGTLRISG